jgi:hypothetical protein
MVVVPTPSSLAAVLTETASGFSNWLEEPCSDSFINARILRLGARRQVQGVCLIAFSTVENYFEPLFVGIRISDNFRHI